MFLILVHLLALISKLCIDFVFVIHCEVALIRNLEVIDDKFEHKEYENK